MWIDARYQFKPRFSGRNVLRRPIRYRGKPFGLVPKEKEMKLTTEKQIGALLKQFPLLRDACIRFNLNPAVIDTRNIQEEDCLQEIRMGCGIYGEDVPIFSLYFFDRNGLYLGQMESKRVKGFRNFFLKIFTKENMLEALVRISPEREPVFALKVYDMACSRHYLLLLKTPSGYRSLLDVASVAVANREEIERGEREQAEREVHEALKKEFGE